MRELATRLWHWSAPHPQWEEGEPWGPEVSSYAADDGEHLLLFDPIAPPGELEELARERDTAIVLTCPWHERDSEGLVERLGVPVYTSTPDTAQEIMEKWNVPAERAGDGAPDVVWLLKEGRGEARVYAGGDRLDDVGVDTFPGQKRNDAVLWVPSQGAVITGDTLVDFGDGLQINERWLDEEMTRERVVAGLAPLLELAVEHVLAAHGGPFEPAALERALQPATAL